MSKSHDIPTEAVEAVQSVGEDIQRLGELDDEEFHEFTALMETLGYEDEAEALRSSRRDWLKALGVAGAGLAAGGASGMAVTGTARADPKSTQEGTYGDGNEDWEVQDIDANHVASNSVQTGEQTLGDTFRSGFEKPTPRSSAVEDGYAFYSESDIYDPRGTDDWASRPDIIERDNGDWVLIYTVGPDNTLGADNKLHIRFSDDEGRNWTAANTDLDGDPVSGFPHDPAESVYGGILVQCDNGDLVCLVGNADSAGTQYTGTRQLRSTDDGQSWTDEGKLAIQNNPNSDDGTLVYQDKVVHPETGTIYVTSFIDPNNDIGAPFRAGFVKSPDNGQTWEHITEITGDGWSESGVACLGNGEWVALLVDDANGPQTGLTRSVDDGETWTGVIDKSDQLGTVGRPRLYKEGELTPSMYDFDGSLILSGRFTDYEAGEEPAFVAVSNDGARGWTHPEVANVYSAGGYGAVQIRGNNDLYQVAYGGVATAADIIENVYKPVQASVGQGGMVGASGGTTTQSGFTSVETIDFDKPFGKMSGVTADGSGITIDEAGWYTISGFVTFEDLNDSEAVVLAIQDEANSVRLLSEYGSAAAASSNETFHTGEREIYFDGGEKVRLQALTGSGSSRTARLTGGNDSEPTAGLSVRGT